MKCFNCHSEIPNDSVFCTNCGAKLTVPPVIQPQQPRPKQPQQPRPQQPQRPPVQQARPQFTYQQEAAQSPEMHKAGNNNADLPQKKGSKTVIIVVVILALLGIIIGVVAALLLSKGKASDDDQIIYDQTVDEQPEEAIPVETETDAETTAESIKETAETIAGNAVSIEKQTQPETEKKVDPKDVTASVFSSRPQFDESKYKKVTVTGASASSVIDQDGYNNSAMVMFDGLDETSWQEGVYGYGIGEFAQCDFDATYNVQYICFKLGNWRDYDWFYSNGVPSKLGISMGGFANSASFAYMDNGPVEQWVALSAPVSANQLKVTIEDVWSGYEYEDTCIAEIIIYGEKQ